MSTRHSDKVPTLLFLGTRGVFSRAVLSGLLETGHAVRAFLLAGSAAPPLLRPAPTPPVSALPMLASPVGDGAAALAWAHGVPVWEGRPTVEWVAAQRVEGMVVACWPYRLPESLLTATPWGCLNIHPSLLPEFRGPAPLFWQLRAGQRRAGVSIHRMTARLDEGPLLAQAPFSLPQGATGAQLDRLAGHHGAQLLHGVVRALRSGRMDARPQPPGGSYQGWPEESDWFVPREWSARRAWNFMRGTEEWGHPYTIPLPEGPLQVHRACSVAPTAALRVPSSRRGDRIAVAFSPGVLLVE